MKQIFHNFTFSPKDDILSGLTVALALVPEAVAFSFVAGIDPLVGLYGAFMMGIVTALFGGRPGMISGATGAMAVVMVHLIQRGNILIVALDKHYWQYLDKFPDSTYILLHDPNELKNRKNIKIDKENNLLINTLKRCNCLTIRETVQKYLLDNFDIKSILKAKLLRSPSPING